MAYYAAMKEINKVAGVGAGIGGSFGNTNKLKVMKFKEAMHGKDKIRGRRLLTKNTNEYRSMGFGKRFLVRRYQRTLRF